MSKKKKDEMILQLSLVPGLLLLSRASGVTASKLAQELSDDLYQKIAAEMNLPETAFVIKHNPSDDFTTDNVNPALVFDTRSGELAVTPQGDGYVLDFPLNPPTEQDPNEFRDIIKAAVGDLPVQDVYLSANTKKLMVRLDDSCDRSVLTSLKIDPILLQSSEKTGKVKGLILTMKGSPDSQPGYDFYSRYFAPWNGITEDPVTAYQCSSRGGELELEVRDDGRINIAGQVVTVLQGTIIL
ncbi:Phenazine biosynthesis-like domain-containing protein 1 [Nibea albiflora]|uniref:Phenazine biosynthesis-like domain-containing protein 1 n=1 Tax=Nibea albiflora TaxID=240163 RepID=A0ACB7EHR6_NIBAL|nr:Phenazine biosynthesis-like domain-containing protein 1 [Nibea albiflora]